MILTIERVLFLKNVAIFAAIDDDILAGLAASMQERVFPAGEPIIEEGTLDRRMFIIVNGKASVHKGERELAVLGSKDVVGELSALDPEPRSASVTALEETQVLELDHAVLYDELSVNTSLANGIIRFLVNRIREQQPEAAAATAPAPQGSAPEQRPATPASGGGR